MKLDELDVCPTCGQHLHGLPRFGVRVGPVKALILDLIQNAGAEGITVDDLHAALKNESHPMNRQTLRSHIFQLRLSLDQAVVDIASETHYFVGRRHTIYYLARARSVKERKDANGTARAPRDP